MAQARGYKSRVLIDFEPEFRRPPATPRAYLLPVISLDLKSSQNQNASALIRGRRDASEPTAGNIDASGTLVTVVDPRNIGLLLKLCFGAPTTTRDAAMHPPVGVAVADKGAGLVGVPCVAHGLAAGVAVEIAGSAHYDGAFTVVSATADEIVIAAAYQAETMNGAESIQPKVWTHVFKPGDFQPSAVLDKGFPDINQYFLARGCKAGKFSLALGGDNELRATVELMGADEEVSVVPLQAAPAPTVLPVKKFPPFKCSLREGGGAITNAKTAGFDISFGLDGDQYCIGDEGRRRDIPEGELEISVSLEALFEDAVLLQKAIDSTETSLEFRTTLGGYFLSFLFPEVVYARNTPAIEGPKGVLLKLTGKAYYADAAEGASAVVTLRNDVETY